LTGAGITPKAVLATLPETRKRIFERRYGASGSAATSSGGRVGTRKKK